MLLGIEVPDTPRPLSWYITRYVLQGFALGCRPYFVGPQALPPLAETHIVYRSDPKWGSGFEPAVTPDVVFSRGWGDCNDLVCYEVARANAQGINDSVAIADYLQNGQMHAQIRLANGRIRDVSIERGAPFNWPQDYIYDRERKRDES